MQFVDSHIVVTGAGQGIGRALAEAFALAGARVTVADRNEQAARGVAQNISGTAVACDVTQASQINALVAQAQGVYGPVDLWVSNAGFAKGEPDSAVSAPDAQWQASWDVHVMAHVHAARALLPGMTARGSGGLVNIASAAGLLSQIGDAAYSATKAAAISVAQSLAITHGANGLYFGVVCPLYVATPLLGYSDGTPTGRPNGRVLTPREVAQATLEGISKRQFLILPHPEAADLFQRRATDTDRWVKGMQRLKDRVDQQVEPGNWQDIHRFI